MFEMSPLEWYLERHGDTDDTRETYYLTYLGQTDYIPLKLAENPNARTELEKEYKRLAGFAKTRLLKPGETQTLTVEIPQKQLASFNEKTHTWIVEKGKYGILVGNSSDKLKLEAVLVVSDDTVLEQMDKICPLQEELEQIHLTKELKEREFQHFQEKMRERRGR